MLGHLADDVEQVSPPHIADGQLLNESLGRYGDAVVHDRWPEPRGKVLQFRRDAFGLLGADGLLCDEHAALQKSRAPPPRHDREHQFPRPPRQPASEQEKVPHRGQPLPL